MVIIEKDVTAKYVYPVLSNIVELVYGKHVKVHDIHEENGLVLSWIERTKNQKIFYLWERAEAERLTKNGKVPRNYKFIKGYLLIEKKRKEEAYQVMISYLREEFRGMGFGKILYDAVIVDEGLTLMSGDRQTHSSKMLWMSFIKQNRYSIRARDINNPKQGSVEVFFDESIGKVDSYLHIWHLEGKVPQDRLKEDVRLIASCS